MRSMASIVVVSLSHLNTFFLLLESIVLALQQRQFRAQLRIAWQIRIGMIHRREIGMVLFLLHLFQFLERELCAGRRSPGDGHVIVPVWSF